MNQTYDGTDLGARLSPDHGSLGGALVVRAIQTLRTWHQRARGRTELLRLDDHILRDVGLTREQVLAETRKPFWRA